MNLSELSDVEALTLICGQVQFLHNSMVEQMNMTRAETAQDEADADKLRCIVELVMSRCGRLMVLAQELHRRPAGEQVQ